MVAAEGGWVGEAKVAEKGLAGRKIPDELASGWPLKDPALSRH